MGFDTFTASTQVQSLFWEQISHQATACHGHKGEKGKKKSNRILAVTEKGPEPQRAWSRDPGPSQEGGGWGGVGRSRNFHGGMVPAF